MEGQAASNSLLCCDEMDGIKQVRDVDIIAKFKYGLILILNCELLDIHTVPVVGGCKLFAT